MKIGIIKEGKTPPDSRVPLTPDQCAKIVQEYDIEVKVQASDYRCFKDSKYKEKNITVSDSVENSDILLGVKEVPIDDLIPNKTYFFFSHTIKKQPYNRKLLKSILDKNIKLIDYEVLTDENDHRLIAFGKHAGMVGAHNALYTYGKRTGTPTLPRMYEFDSYASAKDHYAQTKFPTVKIVLTGHGRVGNGAASVLDDMGFIQVEVKDFLNNSFDDPVYTQLKVEDYFQRKDHPTEFNREHYYENPGEYESIFKPFTTEADIMINGIYWDNRAPAFFTLEDIRSSDFKIQVIADITCDIAPNSSIPSTLKATTIKDPIFGFDKESFQIIEPHGENTIDMMTIDNLPNELARDASHHFGNQFMLHILPELENIDSSNLLKQATIAENGELGENFKYLTDYVKGD